MNVIPPDIVMSPGSDDHINRTDERGCNTYVRVGEGGKVCNMWVRWTAG